METESVPSVQGGDSGGRARDDGLRPSELRVLGRAIREKKFTIPDEALESVPRAIIELATNSESERTKVAAARVLVAMKQVNVAIDHLNTPQKHEHSGPDGGPIHTRHTVSGRLDELSAAYTATADRAGAGGPTGNGIREPLDTGPHQNGTNGQAG